MRNVISSFLHKEKAEKIFALALVAVIALGILFRSRHFLAGRSLWLDEAMIALDILQLSFWELTQQPLPYQQGAPIGFLFFVKATILLLGDSEYAFRLYSFLTSCASLFLIAILAKRYLNKAGAIFTVALFASNPFIIYYSAETKQYMGDIFATLSLLILLGWQLKQGYSYRTMLPLTFFSSLLLWFSYPAIFGVVALALTLLIHYHKSKYQRAFWGTFAGFSFTGINALAIYWINIRFLSASDFLVSWWEDAFMPLPPQISWLVSVWQGFLKKPLGLDILPVLLFLLVLSGVFFLWKKNWQITLTSLLTLFLTLVAGALQKYPVAERMLFFWVPIVLFFFGAGLSYFSELFRDKSEKIVTLFSFVVAFIFLFSPMQDAFADLQKPFYREHIRPAMSYLKDNLRDNDLLYIYRFAEPAFRFYLPKYRFEQVDYIVGGNYEGQPKEYLNEIDNLDLEGRVWFLFTHVYEVASINEEEFIISYLDESGEKKREFRHPGSSVSLYLYYFPTDK